MVEVLEQGVKVCRKLGDWFSIWSLSAIREPEKTIKCAVILTNFLIQHFDEEKVGDILAHLMREKEIGPKQMEAAIPLFVFGDKSKEKTIGTLLLYIYATPKGSVGWSRVGWGFPQWWGQVKKFVKHLDAPMACLKVVCTKLVELNADFPVEKQEKVMSKLDKIVNKPKKSDGGVLDSASKAKLSFGMKAAGLK